MKTPDPGRFTLRKKSVPISQKTGWVPRAGLDGFEETPQYETVKTVWEKLVLFLMLRHPEKNSSTTNGNRPQPLRTQLNG
jgi:hypothetical protein